MRTEVVRIIQGLKHGDQSKVNAYLSVLEKNYHAGKIHEYDKLFAKRVLNIFFTDDDDYKSGGVCLD